MPQCQLVLRRCAAVHPGYGFLSENVDFVEACESKGIAFLGPTADTMRMFSRKHTAREFAAGAQCPVLPGAPGTRVITFMCRPQSARGMLILMQTRA